VAFFRGVAGSERVGLGFGTDVASGARGSVEGVAGALPLLPREKNPTSAISSAATTNPATIGPRFTGRRGRGEPSVSAGTERPAGSSRAWISAIEHRRLGSRCRHSCAMPRNGCRTVAGRLGSLSEAGSAKEGFWVNAATSVTPTDHTSLAGETMPAARASPGGSGRQAVLGSRALAQGSGETVGQEFGEGDRAGRGDQGARVGRP